MRRLNVREDYTYERLDGCPWDLNLQDLLWVWLWSRTMDQLWRPVLKGDLCDE